MCILGTDDKIRCFGGQKGKEAYGHYHDTEWGRPVHNDTLLFEILSLEGAQAGLTFETVLKKRQGYRDAFHHFDFHQVAFMSDRQLEELISSPTIVRHRGKILSVRQNARIALEIENKWGSLDTYFWNFVEGEPQIKRPKSLDELCCETPLSRSISKELKKLGMQFVGPTIIYAFMQAAGLVNEHFQECHLS